MSITENKYTFKYGDYNGIGKWYMGREIAYVMGYQGIGWLERSEREKEENVSTAQDAFYKRAKLNSLASKGDYSSDME